MRHGPAEDDAPSGRDADRALTRSGRERVRDVAKLLVREGESPRLVVSSPLVRARETAEIVHEVCGVEAGIVFRDELASSGRGVPLVQELLAAGKKRVMLVGHQPDLSILVADLVGLTLEMQKAMVVSLQVREGEPASLRFVLDPKPATLRR